MTKLCAAFDLNIIFSGWRLVRLEGCPLEACPLEGCPQEAEAKILPNHQLEECPLEACPPGGLSAGEMSANRINQKSQPNISLSIKREAVKNCFLGIILKKGGGAPLPK